MTKSQEVSTSNGFHKQNEGFNKKTCGSWENFWPSLRWTRNKLWVISLPKENIGHTTTKMYGKHGTHGEKYRNFTRKDEWKFVDLSDHSPTIHQPVCFKKTCANHRRNTVMKWPLLQETFLFPENTAASRRWGAGDGRALKMWYARIVHGAYRHMIWFTTRCYSQLIPSPCI